MQIQLTVPILLLIMVAMVLPWLLFFHTILDYIAYRCQSRMWKIRDDFVDAYLIKDKIEFNEEDREYAWKGIKGFDEINTSSPITSYVLYRFGYNWDWNFVQSLVNDAKD